MDKIEKALRDLVEEYERHNGGAERNNPRELDVALEVLWAIDKQRANHKPGELSDETNAILTAVAAISAHTDSHKCGACAANMGALFEAMSRWIGVVDAEGNNNRAKLEEVFGGNKKREQNEVEKPQAESSQGAKTQEGEGDKKVEEDDWQKGFK